MTRSHTVVGDATDAREARALSTRARADYVTRMQPQRRNVCVLLIAAMACGGGSEPPTPPVSVKTPLRISLASGNDQSGEPDDELLQPIVARLVDADNQAVPNYTVRFSVAAGAGKVGLVGAVAGNAPVSAVTDAAGLARATWRLGADTVSVQEVQATADGVDQPAVFTATAFHSYYVNLESGGLQSGKVGDTLRLSLVVRTVDAKQHFAVKVRVRWSVSSPTAVLVLPDTVSDAQGLARARLVLPRTVGPLHVTVSAPSGNAVFDESALIGDLSQIVVSRASVDLPMDGMAALVSAQTADRFGNPIEGNRLAVRVIDSAVANVTVDGREVVARDVGSTLVEFRSNDLTATIPVSVSSFAKVFAFGSALCGVSATHRASCWNMERATDSVRSLEFGPVEQLAAAGEVNCLLLLDASTKCWGNNRAGQLGGGDSVAEPSRDTSQAVTVVGDHHFRQLSSSDSHVCAIDDADAAWCWGAADLLGGRGATSPCSAVTCSRSPIAVSGNHRFRSISSMFFSTCGVTLDGDGYCWGHGDYGSLGTDALEPCIDGGVPTCALTPQLVHGGHKWKSIGVGFWTACGLATDGETYCWGQNNGKFGSGSMDPLTSIEPVRVGGAMHFTSIAVGVTTSCGLAADGHAYCWDELRPLPELVLPAWTFTSLTPVQYGPNICGISPNGGIHCLIAPER